MKAYFAVVLVLCLGYISKCGGAEKNKELLNPKTRNVLRDVVRSTEILLCTLDVISSTNATGSTSTPSPTSTTTTTTTPSTTTADAPPACAARRSHMGKNFRQITGDQVFQQCAYNATQIVVFNYVTPTPALKLKIEMLRHEFYMRHENNVRIKELLSEYKNGINVFY